jgi:hypothetical protein
MEQITTTNMQQTNNLRNYILLDLRQQIARTNFLTYGTRRSASLSLQRVLILRNPSADRPHGPLAPKQLDDASIRLDETEIGTLKDAAVFTEKVCPHYHSRDVLTLVHPQPFVHDKTTSATRQSNFGARLDSLRYTTSHNM